MGPGELPRRVPHQPADLKPILRIQQQMHVVGGHTVIQQPDLGLLQLLAQNGPVPVSVASKLQQKGSVMASVGNVKDPAAGTELVCPSHLKAGGVTSLPSSFGDMS
jgi:hypothetical protein